MLRRLKDAIADGDHIWAVIKGSAINNDGAAKAGYLAPSVDGQAEAIAQAQMIADTPADTIDYIECHGTGTYLGDPIEVSALGSRRNGLAEMFALPDGYEIMLGNGGSTVFWDIATFGLIDRRSQHLNFGEFSSKFGQAAAAAPFLDDPVIIKSERHDQPSNLRKPSDSVHCFSVGLRLQRSGRL